jgi:tRNA-dihydrouridine synthase 3
MDTQVPNSLEPEQSLKRPFEEAPSKDGHSSQPILPEDSAVTKAEKVVGNGVEEEQEMVAPQSPMKKRRLDPESAEGPKIDARDKVKGIALVKAE